MAPPPKLARLSILGKASQKNVKAEKTWVALRKDGDAALVLEATTSPKNSADEWKLIQWSGDSEAVALRPNQRKIPLAASKKFHVEAKLGDGPAESVDVWVLWASVEIKTSGRRPLPSAAFDQGTRDGTDELGAVTYASLSSSVIDEKAGIFVDNRGASAKVAPVATLTPKGIRDVLSGGLTFEREVWSHTWSDGGKTKGWNDTWTKDTSNPRYLKLMPDADDRIYDLDGPDLRWGQKNYETYNNFRQWITWNGERCSDYAPWFWQARWSLDRDPGKQITLNQVGPASIKLPDKPFFPAAKKSR
jgi:hypothetical protein